MLLLVYEALNGLGLKCILDLFFMALWLIWNRFSSVLNKLEAA